MQQKVSKRTGLAVIGAATAMVLAGCAGAEPTIEPTAGTTAQPAVEAVELRVSWWGSDSRNNATLEALAICEGTLEGVTVASEFLDFSGYFDKLAITTAAGQAPDLQASNFGTLAQYVSQGALLPLDAVDVSMLDGSAATQGVFDGVRYAVPAGANTQTVLYDPAIFASAGVAVPSASWTWDDYIATANALVASGQVKHASNDPSGLPWVLDLWLSQSGKTFYTAQGQLGFSEQDLINYWTTFANLRANGVLPPADVTAEVSGDPATTPLVRKLAPMEFNYSATLPGFAGAYGSDLQLLPMPNGSQPGQYLIGTGIMWSMAATTKHPEQTIALLDCLQTNPEALSALELQRGVPFSQIGRDVVLGEGLDGANAVQVEFVSSIASGPLAEENTFYTTPPVTAPEVTALFLENSQQISFGRLSVSNAAADFMSRAKSVLGG